MKAIPVDPENHPAMSHKDILIGALDRVGHRQPEFVRIDPIRSDVARRAVLGEKLPKLFQRRPRRI